MGKLRYLALGALAMTASVAAMSVAQASLVTVWGGYNTPASSANPTPNNAGGTNGAQDANPSNSAVAVFDWSGPINWVAPGPQNTTTAGNLFGTFFTGGSITNFASPGSEYTNDASGLANFLASSMSVAGDNYWTYIRVDGTTYAGMATITHDDGASVYQGSANDGSGVLYNHPTETSAITSAPFAIAAGAYHIDYIEGNGSPSQLSFSVAGVPEPATWAMMMLGFAGLGYAGLRSRRREAISIV